MHLIYSKPDNELSFNFRDSFYRVDLSHLFSVMSLCLTFSSIPDFKLQNKFIDTLDNIAQREVNTYFSNQKDLATLSRSV